MKKWALLLVLVSFVSLLLVVGYHSPAASQAPKPLVLKMQSSLPSGDPMFDHATIFAKRVETLSAGRLKI